MNIVVTYAVDFGVVLSLCGLKALLFRFVRSRQLILACFFLGVALLTPVTWLVSPDWNNEYIYRIAIWVGEPVAVLAVPCVSFLLDYFKGRRGMGRWQLRVPLETFVAMPVWIFIWAWIQFSVLGWEWV